MIVPKVPVQNIHSRGRAVKQELQALQEREAVTIPHSLDEKRKHPPCAAKTA